MSPAQGLCAAFRDPDVVQLALALELREGRYRFFYGHLGIHTRTLEQVQTLRSSQLLVDRVNAPRNVLWPGQRKLIDTLLW